MRVLLLGASGFLGRALRHALTAAGHEVVCASRRPPPADFALAHVQVDFATSLTPAAWDPALRGIDAVVNAVGIFRERRGQRFDVLHVAAPMALFDACVAHGVRRVVQVSALGADAASSSRYHLSKRRADEHLLALPLQATVVQPSLVFGPGGTSAAMFGAWAALPLLPLPGRGGQQVQPVHVDDAAAAIAAMLDEPATCGLRVPLVGPQPMSLRQFLEGLRRAMGLGPAWTCAIPMGLMRAGAHLLRMHPRSLLDADSLAMLERGNTADPGWSTRLLGRAPRPVAAFLGEAAAAVRTQSLLGWTLPLLRWSIALVWIVTGLLSLGWFPVDQSRAMLARIGFYGIWSTWMLYGAACLDLALGIATLIIRRRWVWVLQAGLIVLYTLLISVFLPEHWLHPFGPILKNLPMLAAIWLLWAFEERR